MDVRSVQQATSGTSQDFTVDGFGTPDAWIVTVDYGTTAGVIRDDAGLSFGFSDGSTNRYTFFGADDASTASSYASSDFGGTRTGRVLIPGSTGTEFQITSATTTNGVTLTYSPATPSPAVLITVDLISCDGAFVGLSTGSPETGVGFEPTCLITSHATGITSPLNGWRGSIGFAAQTVAGTITQGAWSQRFAATTVPVNIGQIARDGSFVTSLDGFLAERTHTLTSFDADGFTYSTSGGGRDFSYLALRAATTDFWTGWEATDTSPGTQSITTPGFSAVGGWATSTFLDALDTVESTDDNCSAGFHSWNSMEQFSSSTSLEDSSNPSQAASRASAQGYDVLDDAGALAIEATVAGISGGFSLTLGSTDGTARYGLFLVFSGADVYQEVDETLQIVEELQPLSHEALDEVLEINEEVNDDLVLRTIMEDVRIEGEGAYPDVTGQGSRAGLVEGQGE